MFTGIVKELGLVKEVSKDGLTRRLAIGTRDIAKSSAAGDSVSVDGVCLTVTGKKGDTLYFDAVNETVNRTTLGTLAVRDAVNLEDALRAGDPLGGHFVTGHVDCTGKIKRAGKEGADFYIEIEMPKDFVHLIVPKGSVAVDGVSLTVGGADGTRFKVYIIPHTMRATNLASKGAGDSVNLEFDIIGKYISRFREAGKDSRVTDSFLREHGF